MKNFVIEVLDLKHGQEVKRLLLPLDDNIDNYSFTHNKLNGDIYRFYGFINKKFRYYSLAECEGVPILTIEQAIKLLYPSKKLIQNNMQVVKTEKLNIGGTEREVTIVVAVCNGNVRTGYSVRMPNDKPIEGLGEKIALGRAMNDRTNLTFDMVMGIGMDKKYILYAIAEHWLKVISKGGIVKGIK